MHQNKFKGVEGSPFSSVDDDSPFSSVRGASLVPELVENKIAGKHFRPSEASSSPVRVYQVELLTSAAHPAILTTPEPKQIASLSIPEEITHLIDKTMENSDDEELIARAARSLRSLSGTIEGRDFIEVTGGMQIVEDCMNSGLSAF